MVGPRVLDGKYELGRRIGSGTFGAVHYAVDLATGGASAIKILDRAKITKAGMARQLRTEINAMRLLRHHNVVRLHDVMVSNTKVFMVLELVSGGDLFSYICTHGRLSESVARLFFQQLINGLSCIHEQGIAHRDLKAENLLLDEYGILKISDFGLAKLMGKTRSAADLCSTQCGTANYVSPEIILGHKYDPFKADIWACGVILYSLLAGFLPFEEANSATLFRRLTSADVRFPDWFSDGVRNLIERLLVVDVAERATLENIKNHPWYRIDLDSHGVGRLVQRKLDQCATHAPNIRSILDEIDNDADVPATPAISNDTLGRTSSAETLTAFDTIAMLGMMNLSPLFFRHPETGTGDRNYRRTSILTREPPAAINRVLVPILHTLKADVESFDSYRTRVTAPTARGMVQFAVLTHELPQSEDDPIRMVEFQRRKGDVRAFLEFYQTVEEKLPIGFIA